MDPDFDADARLGTADGGDRKIKRLQQEIQRLTARLKEAELFSSQDEGLPVFNLDEVEVGVQIGQGGFSSVHQAHWRSTPCSLKKIFDPVITDELKSEFENEVKMLRRLRHPNVIIIMAVCRVAPALSILTEFVGGGSLFELLHGPPHTRKRNSIDCEPSSLLPVMRQTSAALAFLHAMLVAHRDIKSHNVLLTPGQFPVAKLCDFGLARPVSELCTGTMQWAGTPSYMAPELFDKRRYTEAVDIFAFGVMLWEVMSTEIPHYNMEPADIAHRVKTKDAAGLPLQHAWPKSLKALLKTSMAVQAEDRPTMISIGDQLQAIILEFPPQD
jgi:serine/threonine protein kinase